MNAPDSSDSSGIPESYGIPTRTITTDLPIPRRALALGAHPDDVEFGCGATLAKWAAAGCEVFHVICTDGSKGTWDPTRDGTELVATRQQEQREAARRLRGDAKGEVVFLGWVDGELECGARQRWEVTYWIRRFRPDVVIGHDPWRRYRLHPDHRNAGFLLTDAIVAARDPKFYPEQSAAPHRPTTLLLWEAEEPDHIEDVYGFIDQKVAALLAHESQFESTMRMPADSIAQTNSPEIARFRERVRKRGEDVGRLVGAPMGEAFKRMNDL